MNPITSDMKETLNVSCPYDKQSSKFAFPGLVHSCLSYGPKVHKESRLTGKSTCSQQTNKQTEQDFLCFFEQVL